MLMAHEGYFQALSPAITELKKSFWRGGQAHIAPTRSTTHTTPVGGGKEPDTLRLYRSS